MSLASDSESQVVAASTPPEVDLLFIYKYCLLWITIASFFFKAMVESD